MEAVSFSHRGILCIADTSTNVQRGDNNAGSRFPKSVQNPHCGSAGPPTFTFRGSEAFSESCKDGTNTLNVHRGSEAHGTLGQFGAARNVSRPSLKPSRAASRTVRRTGVEEKKKNELVMAQDRAQNHRKHWNDMAIRATSRLCLTLPTLLRSMCAAPMRPQSNMSSVPVSPCPTSSSCVSERWTAACPVLSAVVCASPWCQDCELEGTRWVITNSGEAPSSFGSDAESASECRVLQCVSSQHVVPMPLRGCQGERKR